MKSERCSICNAELSQCGEIDVDGIPTLDCKECRQRDIIAQLRSKLNVYVLENVKKVVQEEKDKTTNKMVKVTLEVYIKNEFNPLDVALEDLKNFFVIQGNNDTQINGTKIEGFYVVGMEVLQ